MSSRKGKKGTWKSIIEQEGSPRKYLLRTGALYLTEKVTPAFSNRGEKGDASAWDRRK